MFFWVVGVDSQGVGKHGLTRINADSHGLTQISTDYTDHSGFVTQIRERGSLST